MNKTKEPAAIAPDKLKELEKMRIKSMLLLLIGGIIAVIGFALYLLSPFYLLLAVIGLIILGSGGYSFKRYTRFYKGKLRQNSP